MRKKTGIFFTASVSLLIISLFLLASCQSKKTTSVDVSVEKEQPVVQTDTALDDANQTPEGSGIVIIPDASKIIPSDIGGPFLFNYIADEQDTSIIKTVKFQIRNLGKQKIVPYITIVVSNDDNDHQQQFTYGELQPGYKLQKEEEVNIQIIHPRNPIVVTANLFDKNTKKLISKVDYTYLAYPLDS
jgi:hypothetical protein